MSTNKIIKTSYGDYILNAACQKFIKENKIWQNDDPIGFELELLERFGTPLESTINPNDQITPETLDELFDQNGEPIQKEDQ